MQTLNDKDDFDIDSIRGWCAANLWNLLLTKLE
jgi:hypothetical protein